MPEPEAHIRVQRERRGSGEIARVTIMHERKLNALGSRLLEELAAAVTALAGNDSLRAVVLTGAGPRAFIGGADIRELAALDSHTARPFIIRVHACCQALRDLPVPVIARLQGLTLGAGLEIAAACDVRIAADTAGFGMPEVRLGLPSVVEAALLPMLIGWGRTRRLLLLGETIGAEEALAWGLVERVVPAGTLDDAVEEWLAMILQAGPAAIRAQKALVRRWEDLPLRDAVAAGIDSFEAAWGGPEPRAVLQGFLAAEARRKGRPD